MDYNIVVNNGNTILPQDIITLFGEEDVITYVEDKTPMAELVVQLGLFKSKGQARKAGRVGDIPEGWKGILEGLPFTLTEEQLRFVGDFIAHPNRNFYLLGASGCGKSVTMEVLGKYYEDTIVFCASSGVASQLMPNKISSGTAHRVMSLERDVTTEATLKKVNTTTQGIFGKSNLVRTIVVDEAFALDSDNLAKIEAMLTKLSRGTRNRKKRTLRVLLVGDCLQRLPIVSDARRDELTQRYGNYLMFGSDVWERLNFKGHVLTHNKRQEEGKDAHIFKAALRVIRYGEEARYEGVLKWLNKRVNTNYSEDAMLLAPTNKIVDEHNYRYLQNNPNQKFEFIAKVKGKYNIKDCPADERIILADGAEVLTLTNNIEGFWANGSAGVCEMVTSEGCYINFHDSGETHFVPIHTFEEEESYVENDVVQKDGSLKDVLRKRKIGSCEQISVKLAAAYTFSRVQGKTFNREGVLDMGADYLYTSQKMKDFCVSGLYIALGRFSSIGLISLAKPLKRCNIKVCRESINFWQESLAKYNNEWGL